MIPLKDQELLKQRFARELTSRVRVDFFGIKPSPIFIPGRPDCATCDDVRKLLRELAGLNLRISLTHHDIEENPAGAMALGVDKVPGIVLRGQANRPIRFYGTPASRLFLSFVEVLLMVARGTASLQESTLKALRRLKSDVSLKVLVTPSCAYSPLMALLAAKLAVQDAHIKVEVIEVTEFPGLIGQYYVRATPMTVIGDEYAILGVMDEATLVQNILSAAQGKDPAQGGDPKQLTPLPRPKPRTQAQPQQPQRTPGGLIIPR